MLIKIAILDDYQGVALQMADWSPLDGRAEIVVYRDHLSDADEIVARLAPYDAICVMRERTPLTRAILERLPRLRLIASTGSGNASIDREAAAERGIVLTHTGYDSHGAIELTWALILAAIRHIPDEVSSFRGGGWQVAVGGDLAGHTLGILGVGRIGTASAAIARAFGMHVIGWSPNLTHERAGAAGVELVTKDQLFARADIVSISLVLGSKTRGIVGAHELGLMRPTAWLVNTSRGPLVDEPSLLAALEARRIAGAALDVFAIEPLPATHPFRSLPNVIATSHVGFVTADMYRVFYGDTVRSLVAWLDAGEGVHSTNAMPHPVPDGVR